MIQIQKIADLVYNDKKELENNEFMKEFTDYTWNRIPESDSSEDLYKIWFRNIPSQISILFIGIDGVIGSNDDFLVKYNNKYAILPANNIKELKFV